LRTICLWNPSLDVSELIARSLARGVTEVLQSRSIFKNRLFVESIRFARNSSLASPKKYESRPTKTEERRMNIKD